jgi:hypothetical protein
MSREQTTMRNIRFMDDSNRNDAGEWVVAAISILRFISCHRDVGCCCCPPIGGSSNNIPPKSAPGRVSFHDPKCNRSSVIAIHMNIQFPGTVVSVHPDHKNNIHRPTARPFGPVGPVAESNGDGPPSHATGPAAAFQGPEGGWGAGLRKAGLKRPPVRSGHQ